MSSSHNFFCLFPRCLNRIIQDFQDDRKIKIPDPHSESFTDFSVYRTKNDNVLILLNMSIPDRII
ncbi:MAG: hypothetical protein DRI57_14225 [Deltaproteobacteria bacterium]|nr:MAG: hypothetical protein DRI57_14225 [Deltaproteobacteria bacterium]